MSSQPEADELLTIQQTAAFLRLSMPTLYGLVSRAVIPVSKKGKRLYFSKRELTYWIKKGRRKTGGKVQGPAKIKLRSKAKKVKPCVHVKQKSSAKKNPAENSKPSIITYERGKTKITGDGKDIIPMIWTDSIIHWLWILSAIVLVLVRL